jgi:hypothetical protein
MSNWTRCNVSHDQLLRLVEAGQLPPLTAAVEWKVPGEESVLCPPMGYVVSFVAFHECGFSVPAERFIRGVLFEYGLQLQHLNPNSIQLLTDKRHIPLRSASVRTPHLFHHGIAKVLVNPQSKGITSVQSTFTL